MIKHPQAAILLFGLVLAAGCGYTLSPTPYGLLESMVVSVPVATNQSRFADLGPRLTSDIISRLDASTNITVKEGAAATLTVDITNVIISGGAWDTGRYSDDNPKQSASRVISIIVSVDLERPNPVGGANLISRRTFGSNRTFFVNEDQNETDLRQNEAFNWLISDLGQKIAQNMFSEF